MGETGTLGESKIHNLTDSINVNIRTFSEQVASRFRSDATTIIIGFIVVCLILVPYTSNGYWFDDALNSQVYYAIQRWQGDSFELLNFSFLVIKHWLLHEGRPMFAFLFGYTGFYFFHDLPTLRIAQCTSVLINIALFGYILWLLGASLRFLTVWAIFLVGLFQIHGVGLDPVAGFAFHYQILGIQLAVVLIIFIKWVLHNNIRNLYLALALWLLFMSCYEANFIFIPIAFLVMVIHGNQYRKFPGVLLILSAIIYLAVIYYLRTHAQGGAYEGSALGTPEKIWPAYLKQLTSSFPFISYLTVTHGTLPVDALFKEAIGSALAWAVFLLSLLIFAPPRPQPSTTGNIRKEAFVISLGMFFLPAVFPAISMRYQNEVGWGIGTLPVYYQVFGLAFVLAWAMSFIPNRWPSRSTAAILISLYLALNVTVNVSMVREIDIFWRLPRELLIDQGQSGLFSHVQDGDIIHLKNVPHYVNANLIYESSGKRVFIPTEDHSWHPETPRNFATDFDLSRRTDGSYQITQHQNSQSPP